MAFIALAERLSPFSECPIRTIVYLEYGTAFTPVKVILKKKRDKNKYFQKNINAKIGFINYANITHLNDVDEQTFSGRSTNTIFLKPSPLVSG